MISLHVAYQHTRRLEELLRAWDERVASEPPVRLHRWAEVAVWPAARSATVAASTGIEGNRLTIDEVDEVLAGGSAAGSPADIRDVRNYNNALDMANRAALRPDFEWTQELLRRLNAAVLDGLEDDERGEYRREPVIVGGVYEPPAHQLLPGLMAELVDWLESAGSDHTLVFAGLAHLNVVSIHPWLNGNGRTARVVGSLALMRRGIAAPELVNIEAVIRGAPDEYVDALQVTHGPAYQPDRHSATAWLEYFAAIAVDRLELRTRLDAAIQADIGLLAMELDAANHPTAWAPVLLAARVVPVRTSLVAGRLGLSSSRARAILAEAVAGGWLVAVGERRGRTYEPSDRLAGLPLRTPDVLIASVAAWPWTSVSQTPFERASWYFRPVPTLGAFRHRWRPNI
jgi:Fic family protein